jgi:hypothetical protein
VPTPYKTVYVTLGGVMMGSKAIDCWDFSDILGAASKRGDDETIDGVAGVTAQDRVSGPLDAFLYVELHSNYTQDNGPVSGEAARLTNLGTLLDLVRGVAETNTTQTLTLTGWPGGPHSADCIVKDGFEPEFLGGEIVRVTLDVRLPGGALL